MATRVFITYQDGKTETYHSWQAYSAIPTHKQEGMVRIQIESPISRKYCETYERRKDNPELWRKVS